jgi:hypothetical protein
MASMAADMIMDWIDASPSRNAAALSRITGISNAEISLILRGKAPSLETVLRLGEVLSPREILLLLCECDARFRKAFFRYLSSELGVV